MFSSGAEVVLVSGLTSMCSQTAIVLEALFFWEFDSSGRKKSIRFEGRVSMAAGDGRVVEGWLLLIRGQLCLRTRHFFFTFVRSALLWLS